MFLGSYEYFKAKINHTVFKFPKFGDLLDTCFMLVSWLAYFSTLKIEATCSSETSVEFQRTTRRYIPENRTTLESIQISHTLSPCSLVITEVEQKGRSPVTRQVQSDIGKTGRRTNFAALIYTSLTPQRRVIS
jgi:hypothetical protein